MSWKLSRTVLRGGVGGNFGTLLDKKEGDKKQPYFLHCKDGQPIFMAAIGSIPFERGEEDSHLISMLIKPKH